jgi:hypothetical protein
MKRIGLILLLAFTAAGHAQNVKSPYVVAKILAAMRQPQPDLVLLSAHRMSWQYYPENSLLALIATFDKHIETIEVDARMSLDGRVVISHDYIVDRVANGTGFLYQKTWAEISALKLRDRLGRIYADAQGVPQHFLSFDDLLDAMQQRSSDTNGYVVIVDVKGKADAADTTDPMLVLKACLAVMRAHPDYHPAVAKGIVFKLKGKDLPGTRAEFEAATQWHTADDGGLIVVLNPDDQTAQDAGYNPAADSFFQRWLTAPYLVHFEMNQYYWGDGLQPYIDYLNNHVGGTQVGWASYYEPYYFPEGVANSAGRCCFPHTTDPALPRTPFQVRDYRGVPEFSIFPSTTGVATGSLLVTTDGVDEMQELLTALGRRNLNRLK